MRVATDGKAARAAYARAAPPVPSTAALRHDQQLGAYPRFGITAGPDEIILLAAFTGPAAR